MWYVVQVKTSWRNDNYWRCLNKKNRSEQILLFLRGPRYNNGPIGNNEDHKEIQKIYL
jgi:hypothetical protein